jgi:hypothetical protein
MKKTILSIVVVIGIVAGIAVLHILSRPSHAPDILADAPIDADVPTGEPVVFELRYRGITGKDDDLNASGGYGFGSREEVDSAFIRAVKEQTDNPIYISHNACLTDRPYTAVEYKDKEILAVYFDLNADEALSPDERLTPAKVSQGNRRGDDATVFLTPDFTVTTKDGQPNVPFRVILWVQFYGDSTQPNVTWCPMGVYEGTAKLNGENMRFYLFPDFFQKSYTAFGASDYALIPASRKQSEYIWQNRLSSLIVQDKTFYRVTLRHDDSDPQRLVVILAEDKSPRGRIAFKVHGAEDFNHRLTNANLRHPKNSRINFSITGDIQELPVGEYAVSSGSLNYGGEEPLAYSTSFSSLPAFAITAGQTTTVEFGKPQAKLRAVELKQRYNSNKEYKTQFSEGTPIYLDLTLTGMAGETYRGFQQRVQRENYSMQEYMKAHLEIVDSADNPVLSEDMEYG